MSERVLYLERPDGQELAVKGNGVVTGDPLVLLLHGLGDNSGAWSGLLSSERFATTHILAPDLPGCGESQAVAQGAPYLLTTLESLLQGIGERNVRQLLLVGHSLGGVIATLLAGMIEWARTEDEEYRELLVDHLTAMGFPPYRLAHSLRSLALDTLELVNVEGAFCARESFISRHALQAHERGRYEEWMEKFIGIVRENWAAEKPHMARYGESVARCDKPSFLECCRILEKARVQAPHARVGRIGELYVSLNIPKTYVHGDEASQEHTLRHLRLHDESRQRLTPAGHWVMIEQAAHFNAWLSERIDRLKLELPGANGVFPTD